MQRKRELGCGDQMVIVLGWLSSVPLLIVAVWFMWALGLRDIVLTIGALVGLFVVIQVTNYMIGVVLGWIGEGG